MQALCEPVAERALLDSLASYGRAAGGTRKAAELDILPSWPRERYLERMHACSAAERSPERTPFVDPPPTNNLAAN